MTETSKIDGPPLLDRVRSLSDTFEMHYAEIDSEVKAGVKRFAIKDDARLVVQLSTWDVKRGPLTVMLVGQAEYMQTITQAVRKDSTRMMDVLKNGETCDLSKDGIARIMCTFEIAAPWIRGGAVGMLVVAYYDDSTTVPKQLVLELLQAAQEDWIASEALAREIETMSDSFDPATSTWYKILLQLRASIWYLIQKYNAVNDKHAVMTAPQARDVELCSIHEQIPVDHNISSKECLSHDVSPRSQLPYQEVTIDDLELDGIDCIDGLDGPGLEAGHDLDLDMHQDMDDEDGGTGTVPVVQEPKVLSQGTTLLQDKPAVPKQDPRVMEATRLLQSRGHATRMGKDSKSIVTWKSFVPGNPEDGTVVVFLTIKGYVDGARTVVVSSGTVIRPASPLDLHRLPMNALLASHGSGTHMLSFRKEMIGRKDHKGVILKAFSFPVVLVDCNLTCNHEQVPACWVEPDESTRTPGYFIARWDRVDEVDRLVVAGLKSTGKRVLETEGVHILAAECAVDEARVRLKVLAGASMLPVGAMVLASLQVLPRGLTLYILGNLVLPVVIAAAIVGGMIVVSKHSTMTVRAERVKKLKILCHPSPFRLDPDPTEAMDLLGMASGRQDRAMISSTYCARLDPAIRVDVEATAGYAERAGLVSRRSTKHLEPATAIPPAVAKITDGDLEAVGRSVQSVPPSLGGNGGGQASDAFEAIDPVAELEARDRKAKK